jgi:hypothetical protein
MAHGGLGFQKFGEDKNGEFSGLTAAFQFLTGR